MGDRKTIGACGSGIEVEESLGSDAGGGGIDVCSEQAGDKFANTRIGSAITANAAGGGSGIYLGAGAEVEVCSGSHLMQIYTVRNICAARGSSASANCGAGKGCFGANI
jgi:hypothetical protein